MTGSQEPRLRVEPQRIASDGGDAADLMAAYGATLDPWQRLVLDCWLGYDLDRKYTVTSAGLSVPRQNGKNVILEGREFFGMVISGEKILHTAHQVRTSKKAFRRLVATGKSASSSQTAARWNTPPGHARRPEASTVSPWWSSTKPRS